MKSRRTDGQLMTRLRDGDHAAIEPLYDRYAHAVFAYLNRIVGNRTVAEDLLQDVFVNAWRNASSYDNDRGRVLPWLLGVAHHAALNELRRQRRRPAEAHHGSRITTDEEWDRLPDSRPGPGETAWMRIRLDQLNQAIEDLGEHERDIVRLYAFGYSQSEIAARLGQPLGTIKARMRRALQRLREHLDANEFELG